MELFTGFKVKKLLRSIEKYPEIFANTKELIELYLQRDDKKSAADAINAALIRNWPLSENSWLQLKLLEVNKSTGDPRVLTDTALILIRNPAASGKIRLETANHIFDIYLERAGTDPGIRVPDEVSGILQSIQDSELSPDLQVNKYVLIARIAVTTEKGSQALANLEKAIEIAEKNRLKEKGHLYLDAGELAISSNAGNAAALKFFKKALDSGDLKESQAIKALSSMGVLLKDAGDLLGAMEKYENALRFAGNQADDSIAELRFELAMIYSDLGRIPQAQKEADTALAVPNTQGNFKSKILIWKASREFTQTHFSDAITLAGSAFNEASASVNQIAALDIMAKASVAQGESDKAVDYLTQMLAIPGNEDSIIHRFELAKTLIDTGKQHQSYKIFQGIKPALPADGITLADVMFEEARAYLTQNKIVRAMENFLEIFDQGSDTEPIGQKTKQILQKLKKELSSPDGLKKYKLDGSDRKHLTGLLARIPDEDDFLTRLKKGLSKTKNGLIGGIEKILSNKAAIDEDVLDELEELLILSDLGVDTTRRIMDGLRDKLKKTQLKDADFVRAHIRSEIEAILLNASSSIEPEVYEKPYVIMVVGVNGVGKTTTIAKIAKRFKDEGKNVILAAGDTFRAGAIEQLQEWGRRVEVGSHCSG
jgi:flagellar biosynthesis GTPase FlhF